MAGAAATAALAVPAVALAEERQCTGAIGAETVDNLVVPQASACTLDGTFVKGTVKVERAATLTAKAVNVIGNVQGEGAADVVVRGSQVGGSVQVKQGGAAETSGSQVTGDIQYDQQAGALRVADNHVGGSVQVVANSRRRSDRDQHDRRQPPVQGERAAADRGRQPRPRQCRGPVRDAGRRAGRPARRRR